MTCSPLRWLTAELAEGAATSASLFRTERLAITDAWQTHYNQARGKFELLFKKLGDLDPGATNDDSVAEAYALGLGEALRYLAGPPISDHTAHGDRMQGVEQRHQQRQALEQRRCGQG